MKEARRKEAASPELLFWVVAKCGSPRKGPSKIPGAVRLPVSGGVLSFVD